MIGLRSFRKSTVSPKLAAAIGDRYSEREMELIERFGTTAIIKSGETFAAEGSNGHEALLILEGTAAVSRGDEVIATVSSGDIVGERALVLGQPRNATLMATTTVTAVVFSKREFLDLIAQSPRLAAETGQLIETRNAS